MLTVFAHEAHDSARVSHAHIPLSSCPCHPKLCELGTHSGCRRGAELVYPLFNVLLTSSPARRKVRCAQMTSALSLPGGTLFKEHAAAPLSPAGVLKATTSHPCCPDLQLKSLSAEGGDAPSRGCFSFHFLPGTE